MVSNSEVAVVGIGATPYYFRGESHPQTTLELAGKAIAPGDKVVFWEASANRDERVFGDGGIFRAAREPNPHLGFGHGVHFCLGANLARLELRILYEELIARFAAIELDGRPEWTRSNKHTGLRHLPLRVRPR